MDIDIQAQDFIFGGGAALVIHPRHLHGQPLQSSQAGLDLPETVALPPLAGELEGRGDIGMVDQEYPVIQGFARE